MSEFIGHEGQCSVVVRGTMHHAIMTPTEFNEWLEHENCTRTRWSHPCGQPVESCFIKRSDGSTRSIALLIHEDVFSVLEAMGNLK